LKSFFIQDMTGAQKEDAVKKFSTFLIWVVLGTAFIFFFQYSRTEKPLSFVDFETFLSWVEKGRVKEIRVQNNRIIVEPHAGDKYQTYGVLTKELMDILSENEVSVVWGKESQWMEKALTIGIPVLIVLALILYFVKKARQGTKNLLSLGKSTARKLKTPAGPTFSDVGGCSEAKILFFDVIDFLKHPKRWADAGVRLPRGILLEGPPGCGKTLLARAVAGETDAGFFVLAASEFVEMFVGVGAARVRDLFETASKQTPAIIFIDEIDAVGRRRGSGIGAAHDEREQTLNQLLACMDGFESRTRIVVIAATNRPDILDKALLRPGRFDRRIRIPELSREDRISVIRIHTRNKNLGSDVSPEALADQTPGFTGAQIESLINEAALLAVRRSRQDNSSPVIRQADFTEAFKPFTLSKRMFNILDSVLVESASQLAEPTGKAIARLNLRDGSVLEGEVLWADGVFIKLRQNSDSGEILVPKMHVLSMQSLEGTEPARAEDVITDPWMGRQPDLA
jgi:cell division protease FtsH